MSAGSSHHHILATAKGGGFLAGGTAVEFASRFVIAFVLARGLGAEDYGLYVLAISAASLFAGVSLLGLDDAMVRYVAIQAGRRDPTGVSGTVQVGLGVSTLAGIAMGCVLFLFARPIAIGLFDEPDLVPLFHLLAIVVPFLTVSNVLLGTARGFKRMDYAAIGENVIQSIVRMVLVCLLALMGRLNLYAAAVIFGVADIAASVTLITLLRRRFPAEMTLFRPGRRDVRAIFGFAFPLWLSGLLRQFRRNIQNVLLGAMSTVANVGIFAIVDRVNVVTDVATRSIYVAVKPVLAQLHDQRDREGLARLYTTTTRWTLGLNVPFFLLMVLYPEAILGVFGASFTTGATALVIVATAQMVDAGTGICQGVVDMTGHTRVKLANTVARTVLLIGSGALLIPRWGVVGAATSSFLAVVVVNVAAIVEVRILEGLLPFDRSFWKPTLAGIAALITGLGLRVLLPVGTDFGAAALQGAVVFAVYAGLVLLLGLADEDRMVVERAFRKVASLFGRRRTVSETAGGRST